MDEESLFTEVTDPAEVPVIIHGTDFKAWTNFIRFQGLKRMARNHIRKLNVILDCAVGFNDQSHVISGMRNSCDIVVELDSAKLLKDGFKILRSKNDVILLPGKGKEGQVPPAYFKNVYHQPKGGQRTPLNLEPYQYLLILDFEANCVEEGSLECQEIIEFPVVPIDVKNMKVMEDKIFHTYVKPTVVPKITEFCTKLTGITQAQVDAGTEIKTVLKDLEAWKTANGFT